jgi:hypothetical protein
MEIADIHEAKSRLSKLIEQAMDPLILAHLIQIAVRLLRGSHQVALEKPCAC